MVRKSSDGFRATASVDSHMEGLGSLLSVAPKLVSEVMVCLDPSMRQPEIMKKFDVFLKAPHQEAMTWVVQGGYQRNQPKQICPSQNKKKPDLH